MATQITADDIQYVENVVSKKYELNQNSDGLFTVAFDANSTNTVSQSYYNKLNSYFYVSDKTITGSNDASRGQIASYSKSHLYPHTEHSGSARQHKNKWYGKGVLFNIPKKYYGEAIRAKTFQIHDSSGTNNLIVRDDGHGNLYQTTPSTYIDSTTSPSSSNNYIGNIFYEYGIVVLSETGSITDANYLASGTTYEMIFNSKKVIHTLVYDCNLPSNQYNWTSNLTILKKAPQEVNLKVAVHSQREANVVELQDVQSYHIEDAEINPRYRNSDFHTFVTELDFYNAKGELLMTANLPQPLRKSKIKDIKIKVQMDY